MRSILLAALLLVAGCGSSAAYEEGASSGNGDDACFSQDVAHDSGDSSAK